MDRRSCKAACWTVTELGLTRFLLNFEHLFQNRTMDYQQVQQRRALQRVRNMPFLWSLNPYRGCRHACLYCYARGYSEYFGYTDPGQFDVAIQAKVDLPALLASELKAKRLPPSEIAIGTATDPYQPLEAKLRLTRRCLEVLLAHGAAITITTKSPLVRRDFDLLQAFAAYGGVRVNVTVTVLDEHLWRLLEPQTARPTARLELLSALTAAGIPAALFIAPVIPLLGEGEVERILFRCRKLPLAQVMIEPLRLAHGVRDWLWPRLSEHYPGVVAQLDRLYGEDDLPSHHWRTSTLGRLRRLARQLGLPDVPPPLNSRPRQPTLFPISGFASRGRAEP